MDRENMSLSTVDSLDIDTSLNLTTTVKCFLGMYNVIVILIGFLGNVGVLYCSLRHGAIDMDKTTLAFIENLALADILISILYYVPMLVTLICGRWVFGPDLCWFVGFFSSHIPFLAEILVIMSISCYRVWVLKKPPDKRKRIRVTHVKILISCIWVVITIPVIYWVVQGSYAFYNPKILICWSSNHLPQSDTYLSTKIFTIFFVAVPMAIVFLTNVKIIYTVILQSLTVGLSLMPHIRSILAVTLICWAFLASYVPIFVLLILKSADATVPSWFVLFQVYAKSIHVILNPFIYVATNKRFKRYILHRIRRQDQLELEDTVDQEADPLNPPSSDLARSTQSNDDVVDRKMPSTASDNNMIRSTQGNDNSVVRNMQSTCSGVVRSVQGSSTTV